MRQTIALVSALAFLATPAFGQCDPTMALRDVLEEYLLLDEPNLPQAERDAKRTAILEEGLSKNPHDFHLLRALQTLKNKTRDEQIAWATALQEKHPGQTVYAHLHARALLGRDTPRAIKMLEALKRPDPVAAQVHLELAGIYSFGKFRDKDLAQKELGEFLKLCPTPLSASALSTISRNASQEQIAQTAANVRAALEQHYEPRFRSTWQYLWQMEFKAVPLPEHDKVRQRIARDLERFEAGNASRKPWWLTFLSGGYESAGNLGAMKKVEEELIARHPASNEAKSAFQAQWRKDNMFPSTGDKEAKEMYYRASLEAAEEWHRRWPEDSMILSQKLSALAALDDTTPEQVSATAGALLESYRRNPNWWGIPPVEFRIAEQFIKHRIRLDEVPALIEEGFKSVMERHGPRESDDRYPEDESPSNAEYLRIEHARILLDYYEAGGQGAKAAEVEAELAAMAPSRPWAQSNVVAHRAKAAELQGRKLDALLLYREAMAKRPSPQREGAEDKLADNVKRLWNELGGTSAAYGLLMERSKVAEAADPRWEQPNKPLPEFRLADLRGQTWALAHLRGKATLINVWATWCGPCRQEHPGFQKLYDKLKARTDVAVLTFNVDDDPGKVAPYMKENNYTFPVVLARDVVDALVPLLSIPRNWFVNSRGVLAWEQIGFGSDPKWEEMMLAKLEEVVKDGRKQ